MTPTEYAESRTASVVASAPGGRHADLAGDLSGVVGSLHAQYDDLVGAAVVGTEIQRVADRFTDARVRAFVPLFVRRYVEELLRDRSAPGTG